MKLLIKQRVFSWTDAYDVYDEFENAKYYVKAEFFSIGHRIHIYDRNSKELGVIHEKFFQLMPTFEVEQAGNKMGVIKKKFHLFRPKYEIDYNGWQVEGDFLGWDYSVSSGSSSIMHISKEPLHWGDTYVINFQNASDEVTGLLLVIAIDAANCSG